MFRSSVALVLSVALVGCASPNERTDRGNISLQLENRIEHSIRPNSGSIDFTLPEGVESSDGIAEEEAVAIALWNNPSFQGTLSKLGISRADVVQAGLLSNPTFSILFPLGPKQLEFTSNFAMEALWLRRKRLKLATLDSERIAESLVQNGLDLVRDVKAAYTDLNLVRDRARLAGESVELRTRIAQFAEARLRIGDISELEATFARVEARRAREEAQRLQDDIALAVLRLESLLGLGGRPGKFDYQSPPLILKTARNLDELEREAFVARPELRASELAIEAAGARMGLARAEIVGLSGIIDANAAGKEGFEIGPGLQWAIPIFNRNQAGVARAKSELERAAWNYVAVKNRIRLEVCDAYMRLAQARENLDVWQKRILPPLEESVRRAEMAHQLGDASLLLVYENTRQLLAARLREAEIWADVRRAWQELERNVGHRLISARTAPAP